MATLVISVLYPGWICRWRRNPSQIKHVLHWNPLKKLLMQQMGSMNSLPSRSCIHLTCSNCSLGESVQTSNKEPRQDAAEILCLLQQIRPQIHAEEVVTWRQTFIQGEFIRSGSASRHVTRPDVLESPTTFKPQNMFLHKDTAWRPTPATPQPQTRRGGCFWNTNIYDTETWNCTAWSSAHAASARAEDASHREIRNTYHKKCYARAQDILWC